MFTQTWKKYLPAIAILIKRSSIDSQVLNLNHTDFERAAGGRKMKFNFTHLELNKGKLNIKQKQAPLAIELANLLKQHELTEKLIASQHLEFSMNNLFQLSIQNHRITNEPIIEIENEPIILEVTQD